MNFSFMSFSCPELDFKQMIQAAATYGYAGVEPRLGSGHKHGIEPEAADSFLKEAVATAAKEAIAICCLATSCRFADPEDYLDHLDQARRVIELAGKLGAATIRVFGGTIPQGVERSRSFDQIVSSYSKLAPEAAANGVTVCMETHDDWCDPEQVAAVIKAVNHPNIAVNWDIMHPVLTAGYAMADVFSILQPFIRHVHLHDGSRTDGKLTLLPVGQGSVDHKTAIALLKEAGYQGYLSGEWIGWEPYEVHLPREISLLKALV